MTLINTVQWMDCINYFRFRISSARLVSEVTKSARTLHNRMEDGRHDRPG